MLLHPPERSQSCPRKTEEEEIGSTAGFGRTVLNINRPEKVSG